MSKRQRHKKNDDIAIASRRSARQSTATEQRSPHFRHVCTVGMGLIPVLAMFLKIVGYGYVTHRIDHEPLIKEKNDPRIPLIDRVDMEINPKRNTQVLNFLNNFVCTYRPNTTSNLDRIRKAVNIEGYCHRRLSAEPSLRTQRVSTLQEKNNYWWRTTFPSSHRDDGILAGELVMRLPRPLQVWDLDALRDNYIQREFFGFGRKDDKERIDHNKVARHKNTQNPLDSGAYLTIHMIRLLHGLRNTKSEQSCVSSDEQCNTSGLWEDVHQLRERVQILSPYLDILPTVVDRQDELNENPHSHPLFWSSSRIESLFPRYTPTYDLIHHYKQMIESEYAALTLASEDFKGNVKLAEYLSMRINVLSRAFGVSASGNNNGARWGILDNLEGNSLADEMRLYETSNFGKFLDDDRNPDATSDNDEFKFRSMCPLLDMYNSHPNPNVIWRYDSASSSFLIHANGNSNIPPGHSIVVSYGKYTDGHLFAKYGYVNGDGTSPTEINLAVFHRILGDVGLSRQFSQLPFDAWYPSSSGSVASENTTGSELTMAGMALGIQAKELLRYLIFDDGYVECIDLNNMTDSNVAELKLLKLRHLVRIANRKDVWTIIIPPEFPTALPLQSNGSRAPPTKESNKAIGLNAESIISTCRLLSLTTNDIGGDAVDVLRKGLDDNRQQNLTKKAYFRLERSGDPLEFRAMMCVVRLSNVALGRYAKHDTTEPTVVGSNAWNAWFIVRGEIRALELLMQTAANEANKIRQRYKSDDTAMIVREEGACPLEYSLPLLGKLNS